MSTTTPGSKKTGKRKSPRKGRPPMSAKAIAIREKQQRACDLRAAGHSFEWIAKELGYRSHEGVRYAVNAVLERDNHEAAENLRTMHGRQLRKLRLSLWDRATGEDPAVVVEDQQGRGVAVMNQETAIDRVLKILEREAKLHGLDAPTRAEVKASLTEDDARALVDEVIGILRDALRRHEGETLTAERVEAIHGEVASRVASGGDAQAA